MSADDELERIKAKRLAEMQRNLSRQAESEQAQPKKRTARDILTERLGYRGIEVLEAAEAQFPAQASAITEKLAELVLRGEVEGAIDGGELLSLYRIVGLRVRVNTTISVEKDGKKVSLSDKLRLG